MAKKAAKKIVYLAESTVEQDDDFRQQLIPAGLLAATMDWICDNMKPEDVFDKDTLVSWAKRAGIATKR